MNKSKCFELIKSSLGDQARVSDDRINGLVNEIERRVELDLQRGAIASLEDMIFERTGELVKELKSAVLLEKRRAAINVLRREQIHERIGKFEDPVEGLKALMVGVQGVKEGSRQSIDAAYLAMSRQFVGGMLADLRKGGLLEVFNSRALDREIARELWEIRLDGSPGITGSKEAKAIAGIVAKWQLTALERLNRAGAYVKELKGYVVRQSHDFQKISAAGFEAWAKETLPRLDIERTFGSVQNPLEALEQVYWDLVKGKHLQAPPEQLIKFRGADIAEKASEHRELHFKSADDWFDYNARFGSKNLGEAVFSGLEHAARNISLMEAFGPEPEPMFRTIVQDLLEKSRDLKTIAHLRGDTRRGQMLEAFFAEVSGKTNIRANNLMARVGRSWRALNSLSKLGMATISSITDVATKAAELKYQGVGFLEAYGNALADILRGRGSGWRREFADLLGAGFDGVLGDVHGRISVTDDLPGGLSKAMTLFFKANGMNWWTDSHKSGMILLLSHHLGRQKDKTFGALPKELRRSLGLYGITSKKWEVLRGLAAVGDDGRVYLSPEGIQKLSADAIRTAFDRPKANDREVRRLKDELETSLRSYFVDRVDYGVFTPGAAERAYSNLGTQAGTPLGEAVRMLMQFKAFSITALSKGLGRAIYGAGADSLREAFLKGKADFLALSHLMIATTGMGYVAMAAKDILKGRTPRDPNDPHTWASAFVQGGGAGIYGDFLFGEASRVGTGAFASLSGPAAGQVESLVSLYQRFRDRDDTAAAAVRFGINNTPFINLPLTRMALDYLFLYHVQESLNPGYLRRMERRMQKENRQTFLFPPSRYAR